MARLRQVFDDSDDLVKIAYAAVVGMGAGALGPWFTGPGPDVLGTDNQYYGIYVLAIAVIMGLAVWSWSQLPGREKLIGIAIGTGAALVLMALDAIDVMRADGFGIGWGLALGILASAVLLLVAWRLARLNPV